MIYSNNHVNNSYFKKSLELASKIEGKIATLNESIHFPCSVVLQKNDVILITSVDLEKQRSSFFPHDSCLFTINILSKKSIFKYRTRNPRIFLRQIEFLNE